MGRVQFCWLKFVLDTVVSFEHINILMILLQTQRLQWGPSHGGTLAVGLLSFVSHTYWNLWTSRSQPRRPCYIYEAGHRAECALACVPSSTTTTTTVSSSSSSSSKRVNQHHLLCCYCHSRRLTVKMRMIWWRRSPTTASPFRASCPRSRSPSVPRSVGSLRWSSAADVRSAVCFFGAF